MNDPVVVSQWFWNIAFVVMLMLGVLVALILGKVIWLLVTEARSATERPDSPAEGMERSIRDEYSLPIPMEVIRFGQSTSREAGLRHIEAMRRRTATDAEIQAFLARNPEVRIDWARDFIVVPIA